MTDRRDSKTCHHLTSSSLTQMHNSKFRTMGLHTNNIHQKSAQFSYHSSLRRLWKCLFAAPVVHAADGVQPNEITSLDILSKGKPDVIVTNQEIDAYISQETGMDRLRKSFTKLSSATCLTIYNNKSSPLYYVAGGALSAGLYRIGLGLRGVFAGSIIGCVLGGAYGVIECGLRTVSGQTQEQQHYWFVEEHLRQKKEIMLLNSDEGTRNEDTPLADFTAL